MIEATITEERVWIATCSKCGAMSRCGSYDAASSTLVSTHDWMYHDGAEPA